MDFLYNDGGRAAASFKGRSRDCVVRAIAIAAELPYEQVYRDLGVIAKSARRRKGRNKQSTPAQGLDKRVYEPYLFNLGWRWEPCMEIGSGCKVHLRAEELPRERIIASVSKHLVAVIDGVIHDTHDCSRDRTRCVYGFYFKPTTTKGGRVRAMAFRIHNFSLRLTTQETTNYERLARENGVPVSEWMRNVLNWEVKVKAEGKMRKETRDATSLHSR